jgi:hypothetical protein
MYYAFVAEVLKPHKDAEIVAFIPQPQKHIHVGRGGDVVALQRLR